MNQKSNKEKLAALSKGQQSNWATEAEYRRKNRKWLRYSGNIAGRVLAAIEDAEGLNQKRLAEILGVSQQRISTIVKGQENLTLEVIAKLADALGVELISFPEYKYSEPVATDIRRKYIPAAAFVTLLEVGDTIDHYEAKEKSLYTQYSLEEN